jgi:hypothetical protein
VQHLGDYFQINFVVHLGHIKKSFANKSKSGIPHGHALLLWHWRILTRLMAAC